MLLICIERFYFSDGEMMKEEEETEDSDLLDMGDQLNVDEEAHIPAS